MSELADQKTQQLLQTIIREETKDIRETLDLLAQVQGSQSLMLRALTEGIVQNNPSMRSKRQH